VADCLHVSADPAGDPALPDVPEMKAILGHEDLKMVNR
jgi:hypothetical protein